MNSTTFKTVENIKVVDSDDTLHILAPQDVLRAIVRNSQTFLTNLATNVGSARYCQLNNDQKVEQFLSDLIQICKHDLRYTCTKKRVVGDLNVEVTDKITCPTKIITLRTTTKEHEFPDINAIVTPTPVIGMMGGIPVPHARNVKQALIIPHIADQLIILIVDEKVLYCYNIEMDDISNCLEDGEKMCGKLNNSGLTEMAKDMAIIGTNCRVDTSSFNVKAFVMWIADFFYKSI